MKLFIFTLVVLAQTSNAQIQVSQEDPQKLIINASTMNDEHLKEMMDGMPFLTMYRDNKKAVVCLGKLTAQQQQKIKKMTATTETNCLECTNRETLSDSHKPIGQQSLDSTLAVVDASRPTYAKDVAPILTKHCLSCHQPGGIGIKNDKLIDFVGFQNVRPWARGIRAAVNSNRMPHGASWIPGVDKSETAEDDCGDETRFTSPRFLTVAEKKVISDWAADTNAPVGNPEDIPCPAPLAKSEGWTLGTPDTVLSQLDGGFKVSAAKEGEPHDQFRNFPLPKGSVTNTKFIEAIEFQPGNPEGRASSDKFPVVHHAHLFIDQTACDENGRQKTGVKPVSTVESQKAIDEAKAKGETGTQPGYDTRSVPFAIVGSWFPGAGPIRFENNTAMELRPCDQLVLQMHYTKYKQDVVDETKIGIHFADTRRKGLVPIRNITTEKTKQEANPGVVEDPPNLAEIPYGSNNFTVGLTRHFDKPTRLYGVGPHQHQTGIKHNVYLECPNQKRQCVYNGKWDFDHQSSHFLRSPINVPAGCSLRNVCTYRLVSGNALGTKSAVQFGPNAENEMCRVNYFVEK